MIGALYFPARAGSQSENASERSAQFEDAYKAIVGGATPEEGPVTVELPARAENGNIVPYTLSVESPMTEASHVKRLHLLSTANPQPRVATFNLTVNSGKAAVTGRMRLAKTQDVVCIAEMSDGKFLMGVTRVEVEIGGCQN
jgi:sulfur-oxidizing protein SoxY